MRTKFHFLFYLLLGLLISCSGKVTHFNFKESIVARGNEKLKLYSLETYLEQGKIIFFSFDKKIEIIICDEKKDFPSENSFQTGFYTVWWTIKQTQNCKVEVLFLEEPDSVSLNPVYYDSEAKLITFLISKDIVLFCFSLVFLILFLSSLGIFLFKPSSKAFLYLSVFLFASFLNCLSVANESLSYFFPKISPNLWKSMFYTSLYIMPLSTISFLQPYLFNKRSFRYKISIYSVSLFFFTSTILCFSNIIRWEKTIIFFHLLCLCLPFLNCKDLIKSIKAKKKYSSDLVKGLSVFIITGFIDLFVSRNTHNMHHSVMYIGVAAILVSVSVILWKRYKELESKLLLIRTLKTATPNSKMKQVRLAGLDVLKLKNNLIDLLEKDKLYKEDNLDQKQLSEKLLIRQDQLSCLINTEFEKSFQTFINDFRINEAKKLLISHGDYSVIRIAYEVGFNSKSSFNEEFKKRTGLSPTQYRNSNKKTLSNLSKNHIG